MTTEGNERHGAVAVAAGAALGTALAAGVVIGAGSHGWVVAALAGVSVPAYGWWLTRGAAKHQRTAAAARMETQQWVERLAACTARLHALEAELVRAPAAQEKSSGALHACVASTASAADQARTAMGSEGPVSALMMSVQVLLSGLGGVLDDSLRDKQELTERMEKLLGYTAALRERIDEVAAIAMQTNLLALNAAIEAARAGASGRGFSVVAHEVRTLSTRAKEAGEHMSSTIGEVVGAIEDAVNLAREAIEKQNSSAAISNQTAEQINHDFQQAADSLDALGRQLNEHTVALRDQAEELTSTNALIVPATEPIAAIGRELDQLTEQLRRADAMA